MLRPTSNDSEYRKQRMFSKILLFSAMIIISATSLVAQPAFNSVWTGASQKLPSEVCPAWALVTENGASLPFLSGDTLVIETTTFAESAYYKQSDGQLSIPSVWVIEFRMKVASGAANLPNFAPAAFAVVPRTNEGNILWIGIDDLFLWGPGLVRGPSAAVDTDGGYHLYRIEVDSLGGIKVYQDALLIINGSTVNDPGWGTPRLNFGDLWFNEYSSTRWLSVSHNGHITPDVDSDGDGFTDCSDNCPLVANPSQSDADGDGVGDACEPNYNSVWEASSHLLPDSTCPKWTLVNTADTEAPIFLGDTLVISTSTNDEYMYYDMYDLSIPALQVIEFEMKFVSGTSTPTRSAASVVYVSALNEGNVLCIDANEIFMWSSEEVKGPSASVVTNDAFHLYRIEIEGQTVRVFMDGVLKLIGATYFQANYWGFQTRFGKGANQVTGTSMWLSFKHNAYVSAADADSDGVINACDNCPLVPNTVQEDIDADGIGDACENTIDCDTVTFEVFATGIREPRAIAISPGGAYGDYIYVSCGQDSIYRVDTTGVVTYFTKMPPGNGYVHSLAFDNTPSQKYGGSLFVTLDYFGGNCLAGLYVISPSGVVSPWVDGCSGSPVLLGTSSVLIDDQGSFGYEMYLSDFEADEFGRSPSTLIGVNGVGTRYPFHAVMLQGLTGIDIDRFGMLNHDIIGINIGGFDYRQGDNALYRIKPNGVYSQFVAPIPSFGSPGSILVDGAGHFGGDVFVLYDSIGVARTYDKNGSQTRSFNIPPSWTLMTKRLDQDRWGHFGNDIFFSGSGQNVIYRLKKPTESCAFVCGDADGSNIVTISDAVFLINYIFSGGPAPNPLASGDADCSGTVNISDAVYLINYIFSGGAAPCAACP